MRFLTKNAMNIEELIEALAKLKNEHGNLPVVMQSADGPYPLYKIYFEEKWSIAKADDPMGRDHIVLQG